jgi:hypothetical protein
LREVAWRPTSIERWTPPQLTRFQPVGKEKRDHNWPAKGGFARLNGDFFNAIGQKPTWLSRLGWFKQNRCHQRGARRSYQLSNDNTRNMVDRNSGERCVNAGATATPPAHCTMM